MPKRKREVKKNISEEGDEHADIEEALEEKLSIEDEEKSQSSEGEGEDLMEDLEK